MVSEKLWLRDWVLSDQPDLKTRHEIRSRDNGSLYLLVLHSQLDVVTPGQIISQTTTEAN